jgi:hypothetical protein
MGAQLVAKNLTDTHYSITIAANGVVPAGAPQTFALQLPKKPVKFRRNISNLARVCFGL